MPETAWSEAAPSQKLLLSKAVFEAVLQHSHRKIQEKRCFWIKRTSQNLTISICVPRMVWPAYLQKKTLGQVLLLLRTRQFVEEMKIIPQNTYREANVPVKCCCEVSQM